MSRLGELLLARSLAKQSREPADRAEFQWLVGPQGPLAGITATCFFLYKERGSTVPTVRRILERTLPRLLAQLNRSTRPNRVRLRGRARGSVDWGGTVKARAAADQDRTIYVCRQSWRLYDLSENQLLKYLLTGLVKCHERTPREARTWCALPLADGAAEPSVANGLALVAHRLHRFQKNAYLRDVEVPPSITPEHEAAARNARNALYREVAKYYRLFAGVVERPQWTQWRNVVDVTADLLPLEQARELVRLTPHGAVSGAENRA